MKRIIVSAADSPYFSLLQDWARSIRDKPEAEAVDLGVLDVGLAADELAWLAERASVVKPGWDLDMGKQTAAPEHVKAQVSRPFLPDHFPGYDMYLWMDADTWVQEWGAVELLVRAAASGSMAIVPEVDRAYRQRDTELKIDRVLGIPYRISSYAFRRYKDIYGAAEARRLFDRPVLNAGVFALAAGAPLWEVWKEEYQRGVARSRRGGLDQISLGYIAATKDLPFELLPARCNWAAHMARPAYDRARGRFVEPYVPHDEIGILHLTMSTKNREPEVKTLDGGRVRMSLRYGAQQAGG